MPRNINVLMTGAGAPGAPGIIQCLKEADWINLKVADSDEAAVGRLLNPDFIQIPKATAPDFIDSLLQICTTQNVQVILPLVTKELLPLAMAKEKFETAGIKILVSPADAIIVANNKAACYQFLNQNGIAVPEFRIANTTEEFIHAAFELGHPQKTFCFKPSHSNGSRGFRIVADSIDEADMLFNQKPYNTYITYTHALKILFSKPFPQLLVSEYLPGEEYSVDCLAYNGITKLVVPRLRKKMINGISTQGTIIKAEEIENYCSQIIAAVGLHGNIGIQVKRNNEGLPLLLEINPRVQGTIVAALGAGVNLPLLAIKQELGMPIEQHELAVQWGTSFWRYWTEVYQ